MRFPDRIDELKAALHSDDHLDTLGDILEILTAAVKVSTIDMLGQIADSDEMRMKLVGDMNTALDELQYAVRYVQMKDSEV